jgi:hypothetical protein
MTDLNRQMLDSPPGEGHTGDSQVPVSLPRKAGKLLGNRRLFCFLMLLSVFLEGL